MPIKRCVSHPCIPTPKNPKPRRNPIPSPSSDSEKPPSSPSDPSLAGAARPEKLNPTSTPFPHIWSEDEVQTLLSSAADFRTKTGAKATSTAAIADFFVSVRPYLPPRITQDQVYNKLRRLHHRYHKARDHSTPFYQLSVQAWGGPNDPKTNSRPLATTPRKRPADHSPSIPHLWTDGQVLILLQAAAIFRKKTGTKVTSTFAIADFFNSVRTSLPEYITESQVYNKLRRLHCFYQKAKNHDTPFYKLSVEAWGGIGERDRPAEHTGKDDKDAY